MDSNIGEILKDIDNAATGVRAAVSRGMLRAGLLVQREARRNAPRSPAQSQLKAEYRERYQARKEAGKTASRKPKPKAMGAKPSEAKRPRRKARAVPGGLEKSIEMRQDRPFEAAVFVAANSPAGKYARRMHDEKGRTWRRRGVGTRAKGGQADEKFIARAVDSQKDTVRRILEQEIGRAIA